MHRFVFLLVTASKGRIAFDMHFLWLPGEAKAREFFSAAQHRVAVFLLALNS